MPSQGYLSRAFALFTLSLSLTGKVWAAEPYEAFIQKHCVRCHGPEKEKGDLRFDKLSRDFKLGIDEKLIFQNVIASTFSPIDLN